MEVILSQDVEKLGRQGSIINVKDGFARNFLIPNGLAVPVTPANLKRLQQEKQVKEAQLEKIKQEAEEIKLKLEGLSLTMPVLVQDDDKMYASISIQDIAGALKEEGFDIDKNSILLENPIKSLGIYEAPVKLEAGVVAKVKIWVVKK